jgi:AcrR family transcriptional regulator
VSKPASRRRRQRGSINAEDIVIGAFEVAREVSLDQLSMPTLAVHLDVGVTSIYWYFRKKEDLLNRMTEVAVEKYLEDLPPIRSDQPWQEMLHEHFVNERRLYAEDQLLADLLLIRTSTYTREATRRMFELVEAIVAKLVDAGFSTESALMVNNAASVFTRGIILHDRILRLSHAPTLDSRQRKMIDWSSMPLLESQLDRHPLAGTTDEDFQFGLARLISGFESLLREETSKPAPRTAGKRIARPAAAKPVATTRAKSAS